MSIYVIWLDRENAKLFHLSNEKMERRSLHWGRHDHHMHASDALDLQRGEKEFFTLLSEQLFDASRILILGPGVAKHHFQNFLIEHFPALAKKIAGCETVDHPTDSQIAALVRRLFGTPIKGSAH